jgi:hypothetical protein
LQDFLDNLQEKGATFYLEQPDDEPFSETGMLPFFQAGRASSNTIASEQVLRVDMNQQRRSLSERGLYTIGKMIFYDVQHQDGALSFSIGKILEVDANAKQLKIEKFTMQAINRRKPEAANDAKRKYAKSGAAETVAFARLQSVQFQLNSDDTIPVRDMKKLIASYQGNAPTPESDV